MVWLLLLLGGRAEVLFAGADDVLREDLGALLVRVGATLLARGAGDDLVNVEVQVELGCWHNHGLYVYGDSVVEGRLDIAARCFGRGVWAFLG